MSVIIHSDSEEGFAMPEYFAGPQCATRPDQGHGLCLSTSCIHEFAAQRTCQLDPMGSGVHSDDLMEVHHGTGTPARVCGYHYTYWPELVSTI